MKFFTPNHESRKTPFGGVDVEFRVVFVDLKNLIIYLTHIRKPYATPYIHKHFIDILMD